MKEAIVHKEGNVTFRTRELPVPKAGQVLIKVEVAGTNPKDWKVPYLIPNVPSHNSGDDVAGTIAAVGEGVVEFKVGDRVAAFHEMMAPDGAFAEYAIAWSHTTFHLPNEISYEEGATLPLAAMTAAIGLFLELELPEPWKHNEKKIPVVVYGGASAVGAYALKYAQKANIHPLIVVAGRGTDYVETLIDRSKGDTIIDYRKGNDAVVEGINKALKDNGLDSVHHAMDAVSEHNSFQNISKVMETNKDKSRICLVLPGKQYDGIAGNIEQKMSMVGRAHGGNEAMGYVDGKDFAYLFFRYMTRGLAEGWFRGHPYEVIPGGLGGVEEGLRRLKAGEASAKKFVYRIAETKSNL